MRVFSPAIAIPQTKPLPTTNTDMKLFISAFCATLIAAPLSFADKCEKKKCDKEKEETISAILADCGKCKKKDEEEKKEEGTVLAGKCKKKCDEEKEDEGTILAGKCKKECDEEKEDEGTILA